MYLALYRRSCAPPFFLCALQECNIVGLHWYDGAEGSVDPLAPTLAVAYDIGKVQLSRSLDDERPIVLDTQLKISQVRPQGGHRADELQIAGGEWSMWTQS